MFFLTYINLKSSSTVELCNFNSCQNDITFAQLFAMKCFFFLNLFENCFWKKKSKLKISPRAINKLRNAIALSIIYGVFVALPAIMLYLLNENFSQVWKVLLTQHKKRKRNIRNAKFITVVLYSLRSHTLQSNLIQQTRKVFLIFSHILCQLLLVH